MPMDKKTVALSIALGAYAGLANASVGVIGDTKEQSQMSTGAKMATAVPKELADRSIGFVAALTSRLQLSPASMEQALHITFGKGPNGDLYMSPDLGNGWIYGVERFEPKGKLKAGFRIGFYNANRSADPSSICVIGFEDFRHRLTAHGYIESEVRGEIGEVVSWRFSKSDLVIVITPSDLATGPDGKQYIRMIETHDA